MWRGKCFLEKKNSYERNSRIKISISCRIWIAYFFYILLNLKKKLLFQSCWIICNWNYASSLYKFFLNKSFSLDCTSLEWVSEERSIRNVHCVVKGKREEIIIIVMRGRSVESQGNNFNCKWRSNKLQTRRDVVWPYKLYVYLFFAFAFSLPLLDDGTLEWRNLILYFTLFYEFQEKFEWFFWTLWNFLKFIIRKKL